MDERSAYDWLEDLSICSELVGGSRFRDRQAMPVSVELHVHAVINQITDLVQADHMKSTARRETFVIDIKELAESSREFLPPIRLVHLALGDDRVLRLLSVGWVPKRINPFSAGSTDRGPVPPSPLPEHVTYYQAKIGNVIRVRVARHIGCNRQSLLFEQRKRQVLKAFECVIVP